jgi:carboxypeptidase Taq
MLNHQQLYADYKQHLQKIADIRYSAAVLQWDQETYMPSGAAAIRAQQVATLTALAHEEATSTVLGDWLQQLKEVKELTIQEQKNIALSLYDYEKQKKYSNAFVKKLSQVTSTAFQSWVAARKQNDFTIFEKDLDTIIQLKLQEADLLGYEQHPYDALLNDYDRGATVADNDLYFATLKEELTPLLKHIQERPPINDDFLKQNYPKQEQWDLGMELLGLMGYDLHTGRQDIAAHPFTINFGNTDVRITTRIDEQDLTNMLFSTIHEGGHALYEQGLLSENYGLPLGEYSSIVVHESQSRLWENNIGKSLPFWEFYFPKLKARFPNQLQKINVTPFYKAINKVAASFIRNEADEITYHFHVLIRYEIEKALLSKQITAKDIPAVWNEKYKHYLGLTVPNNALGCLQDVHWSHGSFGYFSTYSKGTAMAAQLYATFLIDNQSAKEKVTEKEMWKLLSWLRVNLHTFGKYYNTEELCKHISGEGLNVQYLMNYLKNKFLDIYK